VISAFQHIPVELSSNPALLPSLIVLPENNDYWKHLLKSAKKIRRWSLPLIVNFAWVIITALLTIIDSFFRPVPGEIGYGTVTSLAYLLPLIIGWLHVGSEPAPNHLKESLEEASGLARVAPRADGRDEPKHLVGQPQQAVEFVKRMNVDPARSDELTTNPIFNYSRVFSWSQMAETIFTLARNATAKAERGIPVGGISTGTEGDPVTDSWSGTVEEVIQYCKEGNTSFEKFPEPQFPTPSPFLGSPEPPNTASDLVPSLQINMGTQEPSSIWAKGVWSRVALATALALGLQWGTTGASIAIHYKMHPIGLGCRAISLLMYGISGTVSFFLLLASSVLAHLSRPRPESTYRYSRLRAYQNTGAIVCRMLGKSLAVLAGLGILVISFAQPLAVFDNCWCSTTTLNIPGQLVVLYTKDFAMEWGIVKVWVGCLVLAFCTSFLFGFSIFLGSPRGR